ncbi:hypothetical protein BM86_34665 [Bacillus thuringiensis]|uniref:Hemolysin BL lytic component L2 n=1 Tax=Bacillus thuringiensis TaxID=1428 RepID=A0A9W3SHU1_BACTU|nr:HBL/NHE enterotoxin family protein [Bacillus thuringiensis]ANS51830.1 hemolysin BL lytic component L2 [Bacillus thuringiensis]MBH0340437.1 hypothetical protein [Bacillus thuringiensis]
MKKKIMISVMLTSIVATGSISMGPFANHVAHAESKQEEIDISLSLYNLNSQAKNIIQTLVNQVRMNPNVQLVEVPDLNTNQQFIKKDMDTWSNILYPRLMELGSRSASFLHKFDRYYPKLQEFADSGIDEQKQDFQDRLDALQEDVEFMQSKVQSRVNDLTEFQSQLNKNIVNLDASVKIGKEILGDEKGKGGRIDDLYKEMQKTREDIDKDLNEIASVPGQLNAEGWELFKAMFTLAKGIADKTTVTIMGVVDKGEEIEKLIVSAEMVTEKKFIEEKKKSGQTEEEIKEKYKKEIEAEKKKVREKIEKANEQALQSAANAKIGKYDLLKDIEQFQKAVNAFGKIDQLTKEQQQYLIDLQKQNQKLYELTKNLDIDELRSSKMFLMQSDMRTFSAQIDTEISYLKNYKKDWILINERIKELSKAIGTPSLYTKLIKFKGLCEDLKKQMKD